MIANLLILGGLFVCVLTVAVILAYNLSEAYKLEDY
mgnify:CR=1 FL=1